MLTPWKESYGPPRQHIKKHITLPTKVRLVKGMVFPVVVFGCESWTIKKAEHWRIDAFELWCWRRLLRVLGLQGDPTSPFFRRSVLGVLWKDWCWSWNPSTLTTSCKVWLTGKDSDAERDWGQEEKGTTEDDMAGWHYQLDGHEFEWTPGVGDGQGGLACCDSWGCKESDTTEWLKGTELDWTV